MARLAGRFTRQSGGVLQNLLQPMFEVMARKPDAIGAEGVGLDRVGAGVEKGAVNVAH